MNNKGSKAIFIFIFILSILTFIWVIIDIGLNFIDLVPGFDESKYTTINRNHNYIERKIYTKEELKEFLTNKINEKHFNDISRSFLMDILEKLYDNYPKWKKGYKDLPDISLFIIDNLINPLDNLETLNLISENDEKANEIYEVGRGYTETDENDKLHVYYVYSDYKNINDKSHMEDLEGLFHEIIHVKQLGNDIKLNRDYITDKSELLHKVFFEGGATYYSRFIAEYDSMNTAGYGYCKSDKSVCFLYEKETGMGAHYIAYMYAYEKMSYILGYDTMNNFELGQISEDELDKLLRKNTGKDILSIVYLSCNEEKKDLAINNILSFETILHEEMKKDINNLNSYEEVRKYIDIYRHLKIKSFPNIGYKESLYNIKDDKFDKFFNLDELDNLLINKIIEFKVIKNISSNVGLNRMALKALLKGHKYPYYEYNNIYDSLFLPYHLEKVEFYYTEKNSKGSLVIKYPLKFGMLNDYKDIVYLEFVFNKDKFISIKGVKPKDFKDKKYKKVFD